MKKNLSPEMQAAFARIGEEDKTKEFFTTQVIRMRNGQVGVEATWRGGGCHYGSYIYIGDALRDAQRIAKANGGTMLAPSI